MTPAEKIGWLHWGQGESGSLGSVKRLEAGKFWRAPGRAIKERPME